MSFVATLQRLAVLSFASAAAVVIAHQKTGWRAVLALTWLTPTLFALAGLLMLADKEWWS